MTLEQSFDGESYSVRATNVVPSIKGVKISNAELADADMEALQVRLLCIMHG